MAEEHQASNDDGLVQQLFERHLGPPKTLPEVLNASSLTAKWRCAAPSGAAARWPPAGEPPCTACSWRALERPPADS
jgi:hypothetical protein